MVVNPDIIVSDKILRHLQQPEELNVWQWCEKHISLSSRITPRPGPYRTDFCPYVREPQEAFNDSEIEKIVLCWGSRTSKTETMLNCVRYSVACDPQPVLIVFPSTDMARSFNQTRLTPSLSDSPILSAEMPENTDMMKLDEMHFKRSSMWLVGSNSPADLKSRGVTIMMGDEIDTWPLQTKKEAGALELAVDRTKDRWNRKILLTSTPTVVDGQIWGEFLGGDQRYFFVPCPHCGEFQKLIFDQIKWDEAARGEDGKWDLELVRRSCFYECEKCKGHIDDIHKVEMLKRGEWRAENPKANRKVRSYHLNSLYPEWIKFHEVAIKFLESKSDPSKLQAFINAWLAEPFRGHADMGEAERVILASKLEKPVESVPEGHILLMTCDVQKDHVYYVMRAHNKNRDSVLMDYGQLQGLEDVEILFKNHKVAAVGVDYRYRKQAVQDFCMSRGQRWIPIGGTASMFVPWRWIKLPIDGGMYKGRYQNALSFRPDDFREEWHNRANDTTGKYPKWKAGCDLNEMYKKQMTGTHRVIRTGTRGRKIVEWVDRGANHLFDCEINQLALLEAVKPILFGVQAQNNNHNLPPQMGQRREENNRDNLNTGGMELQW